MRWSWIAVLAPVMVSCASSRGAERVSTVRKIIEASGLSGGLIAHVGCGDPDRIAALRDDGRFTVHALDTDDRKVAEARRTLRAKGVYGPVSVDRFDGKRLPYIENLINLIVCEEPGDLSADELLRVLVPDGVALVKGAVPGGQPVAIDGANWVVLRKSRSKDLDDWSHFFYDAKGNPASTDTQVDVLRRYQWIADPVWARHHEHMASTGALVSSGGRVFYIEDDGPRFSVLLPAEWNLYARDAFNGTLLWKKPLTNWVTHLWPLKSGPAQVTRRLVAGDGMVFAIMGVGEKVSVFDAATGALLRTCEGTADATELVYAQGTLFATIEPAFAELNKQDFKESVGWNNKKQALAETPWHSDTDQAIVAADPRTGRELWRHKGPVAPMTLLAGDEQVYYHDGVHVVALNRETGAQAWSVDSGFKTNAFLRNSGPRLLLHQDTLILSVGRFSSAGAKGDTDAPPKQEKAQGRRKKAAAPTNDQRVIAAFDRRTGKLLWKQKPEGSGHESTEDLFVVDGLVWTSNFRGAATGLDPKTGLAGRSLQKDIELPAFHQRCYPSKAVGRFVLSGNPGIEFVDLKAGTWTPHHWTRGGCVYGVMPANGLVYTPPHACACYLESKTTGLCAMAPQTAVPLKLKDVSDDGRLEKGPAYGQIAPRPPAPDDWPTYRADGARSGCAKTSVPEKPVVAWTSGPGTSALTAPVVALGSVFVAEKDTHTLSALDVATGKLQWSFVAGGRIDSPPTIHAGAVLFGCHDGWIYALRAGDGALVWRFRGAPLDRRMMAFDQVASVWPIHGSVLVHDNVLYALAGRSMFLDGGLRFLKLDPATGRKLGETVLDEANPNTREDLQNEAVGLTMPPANADILSTNGRNIFMRSETFDLNGVRPEIKTLDAAAQDRDDIHLFSVGGFLDGQLFHRSYWQYGKGFQSGCNFWFFAARNVPSGNLLVMDPDRVYGYGRKPAYMVWTSPVEYQLFASDKRIDMAWIKSKVATQNIFDHAQRLQESPEKLSGTKYRWQKMDYPLMVRAMALADGKLLVAGVADTVDEEKLYATFRSAELQAQAADQLRAMRGEKGFAVRVVSADTGETLSELMCDSAPAWDGMAAAGGRIFVSTVNGQVICLGAP